LLLLLLPIAFRLPCDCCWPLPTLPTPLLLLLKPAHLPLPRRYFENRVKAVTAAKERGENPYPHK